MSNYLVNNPFDQAFEMFGNDPVITTESVNAEALEKLTEALTTRATTRGRIILLRSPRAGFGKTHLLTRLYKRVEKTHEFIPLEPTKGCRLDAQSVLGAMLRRFSRVLPVGGGMTALDVLARKIFSAGLEPLVSSGEVPSQDRESALRALRLNPVETFDFHNDAAVTAKWAQANFSLLGPRLTSELAERTREGFRPVAWWIELLFRYSSAALDQTSRTSALFETVFGGDHVEADVHEKLVTLLNLTGLVTSPVLVLDEVEGFSNNPEAALQVATFLNALHQSCEKSALILSVNRDVWETAFLPRIPCGLKDRLSDIVVDLKPLDRKTAEELLRDRAGDKADELLKNFDLDLGVVYARGLVRNAAELWEDFPEEGAVSDKSEELSQNDEPSVDLPFPAVSDSEEPQFEKEEEKEPSSEELRTPVVAKPEELRAPAVAEPEEVSEVATSTPELEVKKEAVIEQASEIQMPAAWPRPFAHLGEEEPVPAQSPEEVSVAKSSPQGWPPSPFFQEGDSSDKKTPEVAPFEKDSPFSLDTSEVAEPSPFQKVEEDKDTSAPVPVLDPVQQMASVAPPVAIPAERGVPSASPFSLAEEASSVHEVTEEDHEKVEDLLKQFRNRYGRE